MKPPNTLKANEKSCPLAGHVQSSAALFFSAKILASKSDTLSLASLSFSRRAEISSNSGAVSSIDSEGSLLRLLDPHIHDHLPSVAIFLSACCLCSSSKWLFQLINMSWNITLPSEWDITETFPPLVRKSGFRFMNLVYERFNCSLRLFII